MRPINRVIRELRRRIDRLGGLEPEWVAVVVRGRKFRRSYLPYHAMRSVGIKLEDFVNMGLAKTKTKAKRNFRERIIQLSRKAGNEDNIRILIEAHQRVQRIKHPPLTIDNMIAVLGIQKGYKSIQDTDFGLNGPDR